MKVVMRCTCKILPSKMAEAPEMQQLMPKFDPVIESHEHEVFMETPLP